MRKLYSVLFGACLTVASMSSSAQTTIKANALYWAAGVVNVGTETRIAPNFTFNADVVFSPWESVKSRPYFGVQVIPEVRYYPRQAFKGFYVGGYVSFDAYKVSKWDHAPTDVQHGIGTCLGITLGYQIKIARRWNMDFYVGGGWHYGKYYGINTIDGSQYAPWNASGEWIPYKAGVTFAFKL